MKVRRFYWQVAAVEGVFALIALVLVLKWPRAVAPDPMRFRPPGEPGEPYREMTADHRLGRIMHKDSSGLSPLEWVSTPEGMVTIQRTFNDQGELLEEKALRNGVVIPVPRR